MVGMVPRSELNDSGSERASAGETEAHGNPEQSLPHDASAPETDVTRTGRAGEPGTNCVIGLPGEPTPAPAGEADVSGTNCVIGLPDVSLLSRPVSVVHEPALKAARHIEFIVSCYAVLELGGRTICPSLDKSLLALN